MLSTRALRTQAEAEELRFPGSPTIRVAGHDVDPEAETLADYGLG